MQSVWTRSDATGEAGLHTCYRSHAHLHVLVGIREQCHWNLTKKTAYCRSPPWLRGRYSIAYQSGIRVVMRVAGIL